MKRLVLAASIAAIITSTTAVPAEAAKWTVTREGLQFFSASAWTDQLAGDPVVAFPRGCRDEECVFLIFVDFLEDGACPAGVVCDHDHDGCSAWVELGQRAQPLRGALGRDSNGLQIFSDSVFARNHPAPDYRLPLTEMSQGRVTEVRGRTRQMLRILNWDLELNSNRKCLFGIEAVYHETSNAVYGRGLLLPE
jgi:hypothetical protein